MLRFLLPREVSFFNYFDQHIELTLSGAKELVDLSKGTTPLNACAQRIREIEHKTDQITHMCISDLHKTFITPIERSDLHSLMTRLDDIMDFTDAAASRMDLYQLTELRPEVGQQADLLVKCVEQIRQALTALRDTKFPEKITQHCVQIHHLETEADNVLSHALARLFNGGEEPIIVIKWKEIFESLEKAIDRCQDVAIIIEGVVVEAS